MPPIWVHFGFGLAGAFLVGWYVRQGRPNANPLLPWFGWGLVWGAVIPDTDLLVASAVSAVRGFDTGYGEFIHRTVTHGWPLVIVLTGVGSWAWLLAKKSWGALLAGMGLGIGVFHILPDLFYLVAVKFWAPFTFHEFGPLGPLDQDRFTDHENNVINGIDFLGESLYYVGVAALAVRMGTATRFTRGLRWWALANAVIFLPLLLFVATRVSYDDFLIWIYAPGLPFIALSTAVLPYMARQTFLAVGGRRETS